MVVLLPDYVQALWRMLCMMRQPKQGPPRGLPASVRPRKPLALTVRGLNHSLIVYLNLPRQWRLELTMASSCEPATNAIRLTKDDPLIVPSSQLQPDSVGRIMTECAWQ